MKPFVTLSLLLFAFVNVSYSQQEQQSAQEVIDKMYSVYASCNSYQDKGKVKISFGYESEFSTVFVRPSDFRFEFSVRNPPGSKFQQPNFSWSVPWVNPGERSFTTEPGSEKLELDSWNTYILWKDADSIKTKLASKRTPDTLADAVRAVKEESRDAGYTIPTLLMPELLKSGMPPHILKSLSGLKVVKEEKVDGSIAYKIEGKRSPQSTIIIWIDKQRLLILKIMETIKTTKSDITVTTIYEPQINVNIPAKKLEYDR